MSLTLSAQSASHGCFILAVDFPHPPLRGTFSQGEKVYFPLLPGGRRWPKAG